MALDSETVQHLKLSFQRLLPLVDDLADALGVLLILSFAVAVWIFVYLFQFLQLSIFISLLICSVSLLPIFILTRFWFALENLKNIPNVAEELFDDVKGDVAESWHAVKSGKKGALNFLGQAKKLFEIRSILNSADDVIQQYFSIGPLINPIYLFFGILSLISLFFLFISGIILGVFAVI